ncbi:hypothetical protein CYMTET_26410 [Cymbomonas tetramitiformis]|uniref:Uncharacterized protein n=1 Tax=Cymbomonas tetramitiformis TaxID=36881 RepID=A0AAE0FTC8_9CHLO|nr:hypothetical protein CYMTET_26410 [Cymbomonas tetramitiformis]
MDTDRIGPPRPGIYSVWQVGGAVTMRSEEVRTSEKMLLQQMQHQQEAHDAAMKVQHAESKQHDLQAQLLTEQISALRADAEKARLAKEETTPVTSTGDAELEKLKRLP